MLHNGNEAGETGQACHELYCLLPSEHSCTVCALLYGAVRRLVVSIVGLPASCPQQMGRCLGAVPYHKCLRRTPGRMQCLTRSVHLVLLHHTRSPAPLCSNGSGSRNSSNPLTCRLPVAQMHVPLTAAAVPH